jgi:ketosteroid isomerase-like protein
MRKLLLLVAASPVALGGCAQKAETVDRQEVMAAIQQAEQAQAAALARNNLDGALKIVTEESTLYVPGMPPAHGREAIKRSNARALADPAFNVVVDEASRKWWIARSADLATTTYTTTWTHTDVATGKPVSQPLVSQTTWARQPDGSWKNVMDINAVYPTSNVPGGSQDQ